MRAAEHKQNVNILVADDESMMREIVMNALSAGGYREIRPVFRLSQLAEVLESAYMDLLVINGEMPDGDAVDLVRKMRLFQIGRNPFVPVIMTTWHSEGRFVRRVVDGGVDVLVTKPFAAGQLFARIDFLINGRPPFVATANYIGPDRRKARRDGGAPLFDVPNTLRERINGQVFNSDELAARISKTFADMRGHRRRMQATEIGRLGAELSKATREDQARDDRLAAFDALKAVVAPYLAELPAEGKEKEPARALAGALKEIAGRAGDCTVADCDRLSGIIARIGVSAPAKPDAAFEDDGDDLLIQTRTAA